MADLGVKTQRSLQELGIGDEAGVEALLGELRATLDTDLSAVSSVEALEEFRVRWLGRKQGLLGAANDHWLKSAAGPLKRAVGRLLNELKQHADQSLEVRRQAVERGAAESRLATERLDVTLPGVRRPLGSRHPIRLLIEEIQDIFVSMGYSVADGPEIESDYYNFTALNFPLGHPARDTQDTLFVTDAGDYLLRTHTSTVQIRGMEKQAPPMRAIQCGKVYRRDTPDASHSFMFHQVDGFAVDTNITLGDLKGTLDHFFKQLFGPRMRTRFRPSFFPFTEPSAEMDMSCLICSGSGCPACKQTGWMEALGCGMIDPAVFGFVNVDPERYSGFAWGMGVDRIAMQYYGIDDIQLLFQGDVRFLKQFR